MGDNTRDVLTTLIQVAGGFVTGLAVAVIGFRYARRLEGDRRAHEAATRRDDLDRQRSERWLRDVREVSARALNHAEQVTVTLAQKRMDDYLTTQMAFNQDVAEIRLLSRALEPAAADLVAALVTYGDLLSRQRPPGNPLAKGPERDSYLAASRAFELAVGEALRG